MELNVFSLCTYGQLATNLGKRDIEPPYQYKNILETTAFSIFILVHAVERRERQPCKFIVKTKNIIKKTVG